MVDSILFESADRALLEDGTGIVGLDDFPAFSATLGTVTDTGSVSPPTGWASGRSLNVNIPEISAPNDATANLALRNMSGTAGLILFHAGSNNPAWWDDGSGTQSAFMTELVNRGYRLAQVQGGTNYWMNSPSASDLGSHVVAKRPASLFQYVHDTYSDGLPFIVVGSSAGSSAAAYALVFMGLETIIDRVVHVASVPHASVWRSCAKAFNDDAFWGASAESSNLIDIAHGYAGDDTGPCYLGDASTEGALWGESNLVGRPTSWYQWPSTTVDEIVGDFDPFLPQGLLYHQQLKDASQAHRLGLIPQGVHVVLDTDKGRQTILAAIDQKPYLGAWGEASSDSAASLTVTLDEAPATGQVIVAFRKWRGADAVGTLGSGWTRRSTVSTSGGSPLTVAIETRTSDGTEGTSLSFATSSAVESAVTACVVLRTDEQGLSVGTSTTTGTGTSASFSTGAVNADAVTFAAIVVEDAGANTMGQTWTNDHDQFGGSLENFSTAYAIHSTSGTKTTGETWVESAPYAGTMLTLTLIEVVPTDSAHGHSAESPALTQVHELAPVDSAHGHTAEASTISISVTITADDSAHAHTAESPALTQVHAVAPVDSAHAHSVESPTLSQAHELAPVDSAHTHTVEAPSVTQDHSLAPADSAHTHASDAPALTQVHELAAADSLHAHTSETSTLSTDAALTPDDSTHGHTAESPAVTQVHELAPADTAHGHTTDTPTLTQAHALAPADTAHAHASDLAALSQAHALVALESLHTHTSDSSTIALLVVTATPATRISTATAEPRSSVAAAAPRTSTATTSSRTSSN